LKQLTGTVKKISSIMDILAGICIFSVMLLVVSNIILRTFFKQPILGTYEMVGFLIGIAIALALAHCAFQNGHVAVSIVMDRFSDRIKSFTAIIVQIASLLFAFAAAWSLVKFGDAMKIRGLVSPSSAIPVYPFIYLVALGVLGLGLVIVYQFLVSCREAAGNVTTKNIVGNETAKKVA
jgi:TRAP-type C4-dicarboxylate transport system permease small subunit